MSYLARARLGRSRKGGEQPKIHPERGRAARPVHPPTQLGVRCSTCIQALAAGAAPETRVSTD
jgi:hypothetical protein